MSTQIYKKSVFVLSLMGVLFSGYLSGTKFFTETCAFNESCPYFYGYPACYFGFALFLILFLTSLMLIMGKVRFMKATKINTLFSGIGVLFSGYFAYPEVRGMFDGTFQSRFLGLSTCSYGFIFFALVFIISVCSIIRRR